MKYVCIITAVMGGAMLAMSSSCFSQPQKVFKIGYLANDPNPNAPTTQAFRDGLRDLGWAEGKNIDFRFKSSYGRDERFSEIAAEFVRDNVDIMVTTNSGSTRAAMGATDRIPIVFGSAANPVEQKFVASLARPGGNVTGLALLLRELGPKRLQLLKDILPRATRVARLFQANVPTAPTGDDNAPAFGITLVDIPVPTVDDIEEAIAIAARKKVDAITVQSDGMLVINRNKISDVAKKYRLPVLCADTRFTEAGALASYGENFSKRYRRAATYVDKILRGAKPADLPVELSMEFELVINLKTARELGITIPKAILTLADRIIE